MAVQHEPSQVPEEQQDVDAELDALLEGSKGEEVTAEQETNKSTDDFGASKDAAPAGEPDDLDVNAQDSRAGAKKPQNNSSASGEAKEPATKDMPAIKKKRGLTVARKPVLVSCNAADASASALETPGKTTTDALAPTGNAAKPAAERKKKEAAAGEKRAKKKAAKEDTGPKIKKARSAYIFFASDKRGEVKAAHPEYTLGEIGKELGAMWGALSLGDKAHYQEKAADDKQRAQKERADAGLGTPAARKATKPLAASKAKSKASADVADTESGQAQAVDSDEAVQAAAAKGASAKKTKAKRKRSKETKPATEDKAATGISLEDLTERMDVDWQAHPAESIITQTTDGSKFVVKRAGLGFAEFGLVDARAAKRQRAEATPAEGSKQAPLPLTLVDEYERFAAKFHAAVHDHTEEGELDLEDLAPGSLLDACSFLGFMREEPFLLHRAAKGRDTTMKVPVLGLSLLVQRMLAAEAAKRAEAEAQVAGLRAKVKELEMQLGKGNLLTAGEE